MLPTEHMRTLWRLAPVTPITRFALVRLREAGSSQFDPLLVLLYVRYIARYFETGPLAGRLQLCLRDQHYNSYRTRVVLNCICGI